MLLKDLYPSVKQHITEKIPEADLVKYAAAIAELPRYKSGEGDILMRVSWDLLWTCYNSSTVCEWTEKYGCNDKHITTLVYKVLKDNYPAAYAYIQEVTEK